KDIGNVDSPLLNLPAELRIKIWTYVLGDRLIIINSTKVFGKPQSDVSDNDEMPKSLRRAAHHLRRTWGRVFRIVEPSAVTTFEKYRLLKERVRGYTKALEFYTTTDGPRVPCPAIDLNILRTSRQIYEEAFYILWTTNDFLFHRPITFRKFTRSLSLLQKNTLSRVQIDASIDPRTNQAQWWDRELGDHLAKKLPALKQLGITLKLRADPYRCPWIDLNEFHTSSTVDALSCLQTVPRTKFNVSLDRDHDNTRFMFPDRLFDKPTSPYRNLIRTQKDRTGFTASGMEYFICDHEVIKALEMFYEAFILHHPDVGKVKAEYKRKYHARPLVTFSTEEDKKKGQERGAGDLE
ncbi:MAG: hypothetical protein L6R42_002271, partial [Xanthoria sp. 1 TBL-2021]